MNSTVRGVATEPVRHQPTSETALPLRFMNSAATDRWMLPLVWMLSAIYLLAYLRFGWIPHDEGTIGHAAERVLLGELPHRDFEDTYTGGLSFLHALAFRMAGMNLIVPRVVLLIAALLWIPAVYRLARRFVPPLGAAGVTACALVWSLPNYFVAMPSWYNLFFATFFAAALFVWVETRSPAWLVAAGMFAGLSMLAKITGIYLVAAGLLFLAYLEADEAARASPGETPAGRGVSLLLAGALAAFLALVFFALLKRPSAAQTFHFFLPVTFCALLVVWLEWRQRTTGDFQQRLSTLTRNVACFSAGIVTPLVAFSIPYAAAGAFGDLLHGVFILPSERLAGASADPPRVYYSGLALLNVLGVLALLVRVRPSLAVLAGTLLFFLPGFHDHWHLLYTLAARSSVPVIVAAGVLVLIARKRDGAASVQRQHQATALLVVLALSTLIQFPFSGSIYFLYVAPLAVLAVAAVLSLWKNTSGVMSTGLLLFTLGFGVLWVNHLPPFSRGYYFVPGANTATMALPRAGALRVPPADAAVHERLVELLLAHARTPYTYAGPDAPHVYFLSGLRNPTPHLFEFFADPHQREQRLLAAIDSTGISVVALNRMPHFSPAVSPGLLNEFLRRFPSGEVVGPYLVMWKE